jgi:CRP-like cAMP-binding protein
MRPAGGFLSQLTKAEVEALMAAGRRRRYARGATLFEEGDQSDRVVIVLTGRVKVSSFSHSGKETILAVREAGDLIGELSTLDGQPRSATATALDAVEALLVPAAGFLSYLSANPRLGPLLLQMLSRRLRESDRKRIEFGTADAPGRVAAHLLQLAEQYGEPESGGTRITLPLSQQELAAWLGLSREAVSKALREYRARGWLRTHRRAITVLAPDALRRRAT